LTSDIVSVILMHPVGSFLEQPSQQIR